MPESPLPISLLRGGYRYKFQTTTAGTGNSNLFPPGTKTRNQENFTATPRKEDVRLFAAALCIAQDQVHMPPESKESDTEFSAQITITSSKNTVTTAPIIEKFINTNEHGIIDLFLRNSASAEDFYNRRTSVMLAVDEIKLRPYKFGRGLTGTTSHKIRSQYVKELLANSNFVELALSLVDAQCQGGIKALREKVYQQEYFGFSPTHLESRLKDIRSYPPDKRTGTLYPPIFQYTLSPTHAYLLAIDRNAPDTEFGPEIYNSGGECANPDYVAAVYEGCKILESIPPQDLTFENLIECQEKVLGTKLDILNVGPSVASNPMGGVTQYYRRNNSPEKFFSSNDFVDHTGYNNDGIIEVLLGDRCTYAHINSNHELYKIWDLNTAPVIASSYENLEQITATYNNYQSKFLANISDAGNDSNQQIAAILLFVSQISGAHFFKNGNGRLSRTILLNKLLIFYGLHPSILYIPNGMTHYVLSLVNIYMRKTGTTDKIPDINGLTIALSRAISWVLEGQEFAKQFMQKAEQQQ